MLQLGKYYLCVKDKEVYINENKFIAMAFCDNYASDFKFTAGYVYGPCVKIGVNSYLYNDKGVLTRIEESDCDCFSDVKFEIGETVQNLLNKRNDVILSTTIAPYSFSCGKLWYRGCIVFRDREGSHAVYSIDESQMGLLRTLYKRVKISIAEHSSLGKALTKKYL